MDAEVWDVGSLSHVLSALSHEVRCGICLRWLSDPRVLSCAHSFCMGCLKNWHWHRVADALAARKKTLVSAGRGIIDFPIECPTCRSKTFADAELEDLGLWAHVSLAKLVLLLRANEHEKLAGDCDGCAGTAVLDGLVKPDEVNRRCPECAFSLCRECARHHRENMHPKPCAIAGLFLSVPKHLRADLAGNNIRKRHTVLFLENQKRLPFAVTCQLAHTIAHNRYEGRRFDVRPVYLNLWLNRCRAHIGYTARVVPHFKERLRLQREEERERRLRQQQVWVRYDGGADQSSDLDRSADNSNGTNNQGGGAAALGALGALGAAETEAGAMHDHEDQSDNNNSGRRDSDATTPSTSIQGSPAAKQQLRGADGPSLDAAQALADRTSFSGEMSDFAVIPTMYHTFPVRDNCPIDANSRVAWDSECNRKLSFALLKSLYQLAVAHADEASVAELRQHNLAAFGASAGADLSRTQVTTTTAASANTVLAERPQRYVVPPPRPANRSGEMPGFIQLDDTLFLDEHALPLSYYTSKLTEHSSPPSYGAFSARSGISNPAASSVPESGGEPRSRQGSRGSTGSGGGRDSHVGAGALGPSGSHAGGSANGNSNHNADSDDDNEDDDDGSLGRRKSSMSGDGAGAADPETSAHAQINQYNKQNQKKRTMFTLTRMDLDQEYMRQFVMSKVNTSKIPLSWLASHSGLAGSGGGFGGASGSGSGSGQRVDGEVTSGSGAHKLCSGSFMLTDIEQLPVEVSYEAKKISVVKFTSVEWPVFLVVDADTGEQCAAIDGISGTVTELPPQPARVAAKNSNKPHRVRVQMADPGTPRSVEIELPAAAAAAAVPRVTDAAMIDDEDMMDSTLIPVEPRAAEEPVEPSSSTRRRRRSARSDDDDGDNDNNGNDNNEGESPVSASSSSSSSSRFAQVLLETVVPLVGGAAAVVVLQRVLLAMV